MAELGPMNDIRSPETLPNLDILDLTNRLDTYVQEIGRAASATRNETSQHDLRRSRQMHEMFEKRFDLYAGDPELDLPKYHPEPLRLPEPPSLNRVENNDSQQLMNMWVALRIEMTFSDSAERASGFKKADVARIKPILDKIAKMNDNIESLPEIDLPDVDLQDPPAQAPL